MIHQFVFFVFAFLFSLGIAGALLWENLFKKVICLSIFSSSIVIFYLLLGYKAGTQPPIFHGIIENISDFTNPLPSVLMLTAIVVGIAVQAIAFSLVIRVKKDYATLQETEILEKINTDQ